MSMASMNSLPTEVIDRILHYLSAKHCKNVRQTCKRFSEISFRHIYSSLTIPLQSTEYSFVQEERHRQYISVLHSAPHMLKNLRAEYLTHGQMNLMEEHVELIKPFHNLTHFKLVGVMNHHHEATAKILKTILDNNPKLKFLSWKGVIDGWHEWTSSPIFPPSPHWPKIVKLELEYGSNHYHTSFFSDDCFFGLKRFNAAFQSVRTLKIIGYQATFENWEKSSRRLPPSPYLLDFPSLTGLQYFTDSESPVEIFTNMNPNHLNLVRFFAIRMNMFCPEQDFAKRIPALQKFQSMMVFSVLTTSERGSYDNLCSNLKSMANVLPMLRVAIIKPWYQPVSDVLEIERDDAGGCTGICDGGDPTHWLKKLSSKLGPNFTILDPN